MEGGGAYIWSSNIKNLWRKQNCTGKKTSGAMDVLFKVAKTKCFLNIFQC